MRLLRGDLNPHEKAYAGETNRQGEAHGKGRCVFLGGEVYDGEWRHNKRHGLGKAVFASGNVYEGRYEDDMQHGQGRFTFASGDYYEGAWVHDQREGRGTHVNVADGAQFVGEFRGDRAHEGTMTYPNGSVAVGYFSDGKQHGKGTLTYATGDIFEGSFKHGKRVGEAKCSYADGSTFEGTCEWRLSSPSFPPSYPASLLSILLWFFFRPTAFVHAGRANLSPCFVNGSLTHSLRTFRFPPSPLSLLNPSPLLLEIA